MFPRAARFSTHGNDVPGPNAYDPTEPESQYKRGAMFERDARFRAAQAAAAAAAASGSSPTPPPTTTMCPHGCPISLTMGTTAAASSSKIKMDARLVTAEKDKAKLELRASKAEERVAELQAQTAALLREKKQLQMDARMSAQKLERIHAQQQQQQSQQLAASKGKSPQRTSVVLPTPRKDTAHPAQDGRLAELQAQCDQLQARCTQAVQDKNAAEARVDDMQRKVHEAEIEADAVRQRLGKLERTLDDERRKSAVGMLAIEERSRVHADTLQAKLTAAEEKSRRDRMQCAAMQEQSEHYKIKLVTLRDEKERLRRTVSDDEAHRTSLDSLRSENERLRAAGSDHAGCEEHIAKLSKELDEACRLRDGWFIIALLLSGENGALKEQQQRHSHAQIRSLQESLAASEKQVKQLQDALVKMRSNSDGPSVQVNATGTTMITAPAAATTTTIVAQTATSTPPQAAPTVVLDEREAARRAWQMRPKSRSRSYRGGADDDSSSQHSAPLRELPRGKTLLSKSSLPTLRQAHRDAEMAPPVPTMDRQRFASNANTYTAGNSSIISIDDTADMSVCSTVDCGSSSASSTVNTSEAGDAPKRRWLRPQRSDATLDRTHRSSPVASLPSMDALAWELDKENAMLAVPSGAGLHDKQTPISGRLTPLSLHDKPALASFLRDGELALHELAG